MRQVQEIAFLVGHQRCGGSTFAAANRVSAAKSAHRHAGGAGGDLPFSPDATNRVQDR
jgi:carbonic anhydrase